MTNKFDLGKLCYELWARTGGNAMPWSSLPHDQRERFQRIAREVARAHDANNGGEHGSIQISVLYSIQEDSGLVELSCPNKMQQMTPDVARNMAIELLDAAHHAEMETDLMIACVGKMGMPVKMAADFIVKFREVRREKQNEEAESESKEK